MDSLNAIGTPGPRNENYQLFSGDGNSYLDMRQPWWEWKNKPDLTVVIVFEDVSKNFVTPPLAAARLFKRKARCRGIRMPCIGIGGVFTPKELRGKGYATRLLNMLMIEMRRLDVAPLAALYAQKRTIYERLGFVRVRDSGKYGGFYIAPISSGVDIFPSQDWTLFPEGHF